MLQAEVVELARPAEPGTFARSHVPREGLWAVAITSGLLITGLYKGINLLLLLSYLMLGLMAANILLARRALRRVSARRLTTGPACVDQPVAWRVEVSNGWAKPSRGWALEDRGPAHVLGWFVVGLTPGGRVSLRANSTPPKRGRYRCDPLRAWTRYPFGLMHYSVELAPADEYIVLPRLGTVHGDRLRHWLARATRGDGRIHRRIRHIAASEADVHGLRVFRPGDSPRWIHWKTSARRNELMVREFEDSAPPHVLLVVEPWLPERRA